MASADGPAPDHLAFLRRVGADPKRFGFLAVLRDAEARAPAQPRVGRSRLPGQNIVDLAHAPTLEYPAATLDGVETGATGRLRLRSLFLGLTGPMGPLPLHLTEYAFYERRNTRRQPFGRFIDLLTDRSLQLFFRAWGDTQPTVQASRPRDDQFAAYLALLSGAGEGAGPDSVLKAGARLHYAGAFASRRSAATIQDGLSHLLATPVKVSEFVVRWRDVEPNDRTRLGGPERGGRHNGLGRGAVLGGRVRVADDTFRVTIRTASMEAYQRFMPGQSSHAKAQEALDALAPSHLDWELQLEIDERQAPPCRLDAASRLGLTGWLAPIGRPVARSDARLRKTMHHKAA